MMYRIIASKAALKGVTRFVDLRVCTDRDLVTAEKIDFNNAALAVLERDLPATEPLIIEDNGEEPCEEENLRPIEPSIEELVREIQQNGARIHQNFEVTMRCVSPSEWHVATTRDMNIVVYVVMAPNLRGALLKMLEYQRSHEAKEDDWFYLTYAKDSAVEHLLHTSCFENADDAGREGNAMFQRKEIKSYRVHRARDVPMCANTRQCPCCKNNVLETSMTAASFTDPEKYCYRCLPLIRRAHEIDSKRTSSKAQDLIGDNGPFCLIYPNRYNSETLLHETTFTTLQQAHDAGSILIKNKVSPSYTVLRESDVPSCANTRQCSRCKRHVLYIHVRPSSRNGQSGCIKCLSTE